LHSIRLAEGEFQCQRLNGPFNFSGMGFRTAQPGNGFSERNGRMSIRIHCQNGVLNRKRR
jgi:hypothetical protein